MAPQRQVTRQIEHYNLDAILAGADDSDRLSTVPSDEAQARRGADDVV